MITNELYKINGWEDLRYVQNGASHPNDKKKYSILAVINPHSGSGKAIKAFKTIVEPEWKKRGVCYQVLITEYAEHSTQLLSQDKNIQRYKSIVAVGGDGTLAEINKGLETNKLVKNIRKIIKLGIIPVGSGNGLYKSLKPDVDYQSMVKDAAKMAALANSKKMDLIDVTQSKDKKTAFLAITLGLIADIDISTEPLRCLGNFRYTLGALWSLWKSKVYKVDLSYLRNDSKPIDSRAWSKISGDFTLVMISNTSHCATNVHNAPGAKIDDGYLHITAVKAASAWSRLKLLLGLESGMWTKHPSVFRFKTRSLRIESISKDAILTLDGERIPSQPLECRIRHKALNILCN